jgi:hypothetical protein
MSSMTGARLSAGIRPPYDREEHCMSVTYRAWAAAIGAAGCGRCAIAA